MKKELRVLMIEDAAPDVALIHHELRKAGLQFRCRRVDSREAFLHEIESHPPDIILSDHGVPGFDGFAALAEARSRCPEVPFIFVTGARGDQQTEETLRQGADDYVLKTSLHLLAPAIDRALQNADTQTRHRQIESALLNAEEHLNIIASELKDYAAFMLDSGGRVATWNPGAERVFGFEPDEILGQDYARLFPEEARVRNWPQHLLARANQERRIEEASTQVRKSGEPFKGGLVIHALASRFESDRGFLCVLRDLTRSGPDEASLKVQQRAATSDAESRELEEFTHAIALDLRLPLRNIESFSEMLLKSIGETIDPKSRNHLKTISESSHRMSRLIDDLFTFSRIGQADLYRLHLSLAEIVKEVVHDLQHETEGRKIEWVIGDLPEIEGDPVMLWLALTNLISNALKFTRDREVARIEVGSSKDDGELTVHVRDNGVGFDQQKGQRLFRIFQRLHGEQFGGTGVGLANVRRIIHRHGGRVWAEGEEGKGATFYLSLPTA
jgi:PAS domain S-box-containing protein